MKLNIKVNKATVILASKDNETIGVYEVENYKLEVDIKKLMEDTKSLGDVITKLFATPPETADDTITGSY